MTNNISEKLVKLYVKSLDNDPASELTKNLQKALDYHKNMFQESPKEFGRDLKTGAFKTSESEITNNILKGQSNSPAKFLGSVAGDIKMGAESLQKWLLRSLDSSHLLYISDQIDANFKNGAKGVLIARLYDVIPDEGGHTRIYLGLQVAGTGDDLDSAMSSYTKQLNKSQQTTTNIGEFTRNLDGVCTPSNPLGENRSDQFSSKSEIKSSPEGYNWGYNSELSSKINKVYQINPRNIDDVKIGGNTIVSTRYIEREFRFINIKEWEDFKLSMKK
ncbi:MAG: hypothetical protein NTX38_17965 [Methylobacter sp.]|nr:hypothetical protein [Methylobacter sp.]